MKKFLLLTRVLLKAGLGNAEASSKKNKGLLSKAGVGKIGLYIFLLICMTPFMIMEGMLGYEGYNMFAAGNYTIIVSLTCAAGSLITFVFGISMVLSVFYFSSDIETLLPLPLKAAHIVGAKFAVTLIYDYFTTLLFLAPIFIGYGVAAKEGIVYWIFVILAILLIPIVPLIYGSIISMIIMRVFKKAKNKDAMTIFSTLFAVVIVLGINAISSSAGSMSQEAIMEMVMTKGTSLMKILNSVFPNFYFIEEAVANSDIVMMLLFILTSAAFVVVFLFVAQKIYFTSVLGINNTSSKRERINAETGRKIIVKKNSTITYIKKEIKLVFRTPIYLMNCILMCFLWPVILVIPVLSQMFSSGDSSEGMIDTLRQFSNSSDSSIIVAVTMIVVFGLSLFITSMNFMAGSSISREGKNIFFMKYIPMDYKRQINAKVCASAIMSIISSTIYCIIGMIVVKEAIIDIPVIAIVMSAIISSITCILFTYTSIFIDLLRPKLNWETEQAAIKQNLNTMIEMFVTLGLGALLGFLGVMLYIKLEIDIYLIGIIAIIALCVITVIISKFVLAYGNKKMNSII